MSNYINKRQTETDTFVVPASSLDNILAPENLIESYNVHSTIDGKIVDESFYHKIIKLTKNKQYTTTDHCPITMKIKGDVTCVYLSLDNSIRANGCDHPLKDRLGNLCILINALVCEIGGGCIIYFSESCRPSFDGSNINDRRNEMTWFEMRQVISQQCNLIFLGESTNNDDICGLSFGVSAFCTNNYKSLIHSVLPRRILTEGFGSGAIGVKTKNGNCVWGIHIPLDFKNKGEQNLGAKAMVNLCVMMKAYGNSCAFGDFNTIPGYISDAIKTCVDPDFKLIISDNKPTFFGAFFDEVNVGDRVWFPLINESQ